MISQNISSNLCPALRGASSLLSAYEKATTKNVMANLFFTANFAHPQQVSFLSAILFFLELFKLFEKGLDILEFAIDRCKTNIGNLIYRF